MLQYFAQGACMAMEDACCLGHMFEPHDGEVEIALENYMRQRRVHTAITPTALPPRCATHYVEPDPRAMVRQARLALRRHRARCLMITR